MTEKENQDKIEQVSNNIIEKFNEAKENLNMSLDEFEEGLENIEKQEEEAKKAAAEALAKSPHGQNYVHNMNICQHYSLDVNTNHIFSVFRSLIQGTKITPKIAYDNSKSDDILKLITITITKDPSGNELDDIAESLFDRDMFTDPSEIDTLNQILQTVSEDFFKELENN